MSLAHEYLTGSWKPQPGPQTEAIKHAYVEELLYGGARGGGKTAYLLGDFGQDVPREGGESWHGVLFRRTYGQLEEVIKQSQEVYPRWFDPNGEGLVTYLAGEKTWKWKNGATLKLRYAESHDDWMQYHGHQFCIPYGDVLTRDGWKDIRLVKQGEEVLSMAPDREVVWKRVLDTCAMPCTTGLVERSGRGVHMEFTPEHRLPRLSPHPAPGEQFKITRYNEAGTQFYSVRGGGRFSGESPATFVVPEIDDNKAQRAKQPTALPYGDYMELLGWVITEGWVTERDSMVGIAQTKEPQRTTIRALLERCGFVFHEKPDRFEFYSRRWAQHFSGLGPRAASKRLPQNVLNASAADLGRLFEAMMAGDGTRGNGDKYYTKSEELAGQFSELAIKLGWEVYQSLQTMNGEPFYTVNLKRTKYGACKLNADNVTPKPYEGMVYCLKVEATQTFFVRQRGSVWLSGNTWIGWDELTTWPTPELYLRMKATLRSANPAIRYKRIRATANPGGPGHGWVKDYFSIKDYPEGGVVLTPTDGSGRRRMFIKSKVSDNKVLLEATPDYEATLRSLGSPELVRAWLDGDWNVVQGAYFPEFARHSHVVEPFPIPHSWTKIRAMDWGSASPFAVLWAAVSDGQPVPVIGDRYPKGALILYREWYGTKGHNVGLKLTDEQVADGILERELGEVPNDSVLDPSAFMQKGGPSSAERMARHSQQAVMFRKADNNRIAGWAALRARLVGTTEGPMLYVFSTCPHLIEHLPQLQHDPNKPEDADTDGEDHLADALRYLCMSRPWARVKQEVQVVAPGWRLDDLWAERDLHTNRLRTRI